MEGLQRRQGAEFASAGGKRLSFWQTTPDAGTKLQLRSLPPFARCWRLVGGQAHQVSGKRQTPLLTALCSTKRRSSTISQTCKRAAGHSLSVGMEKSIITDFAKKTRSQLSRERNILWLRVHWIFLVCESINEPNLPADGSTPNSFSDQSHTRPPCDTVAGILGH